MADTHSSRDAQRFRIQRKTDTRQPLPARKSSRSEYFDAVKQPLYPHSTVVAGQAYRRRGVRGERDPLRAAHWRRRAQRVLEAAIEHGHPIPRAIVDFEFAAAEPSPTGVEMRRDLGDRVLLAQVDRDHAVARPRTLLLRGSSSRQAIGLGYSRIALASNAKSRCPTSFDADGDLPEALTLRFVRPRIFPESSGQQLQARLNADVAKLVKRAREDVALHGLPFVGRNAVLPQSFSVVPKTPAPKRNPSPRIAAKSPCSGLRNPTHTRFCP